MSSEDLGTWGIQDTADYICQNSYKRVTAQFPDELLSSAASVAFKLQSACKDRGHEIKASINFSASN